MFDILLFPNALPMSVQSIGHNHTHGEEVVGGAEATNGDVALWGKTVVSVFVWLAQRVSSLTLPMTLWRTLYWTAS